MLSDTRMPMSDAERPIILHCNFLRGTALRPETPLLGLIYIQYTLWVLYCPEITPGVHSYSAFQTKTQ